MQSSGQPHYGFDTDERLHGKLGRVTYSDSFFVVCAQLIPVLFLAMVVEERLRPDS